MNRVSNDIEDMQNPVYSKFLYLQTKKLQKFDI